MLLTQLRRLSRAPGSAFSAVEDVAAASAFEAEGTLSEAGAEVVEGRCLRAIAVGDPEPSGFSAFLDGIQRSAVALHHGPVPLVYAFGAAVIRARRDRRMGTLTRLHTRYQEEREAVFFPWRLVPPEEVERAGLGRGQMVDTSPPDGEPLPLFPPLLYARAQAAINTWREELEARLAERWCEEAEDDDGWLLVDGSLTLSPRLAASPRAVGVIKGHRTRFFDGDEARVLLGLEAGERTSIFRPRTRNFTPVHSWYLRLRPPAGRGVLWGLVRVEVAAAESSPELADRISRWLLSETAPLSLPDPRWDRLLYPIHDCEMYLRARAPVL